MDRGTEKIFVAMSGGVDSSVAAYVLKKEGYSLIGATMCLGITDSEGKAACCGPKAVKDARTVCDQLGIPHYVLDFSKYLYEYVITDFISEYRAGRTPNPCVRCNRYLKFSELLQYARRLGYSAIATGHYARKGIFEGKTVLMRDSSNVKDQSYFLYSIPREVIDHIVFPVGNIAKERVRELATEAKLHVASKAESQEICFITDDNYRNFLHQHGVDDRPGFFIDADGRKMGKHKGIFNYTIGQRKGLGIATGTPCYVTAINPIDHTVTLGSKADLLASGCDATNVNLFVDALPRQCTAKVRYAQKDVPCSVSLHSGVLEVTFDSPVEAVTPGQSLVLYLGEVVLGGGIIREVFR